MNHATALLRRTIVRRAARRCARIARLLAPLAALAAAGTALAQEWEPLGTLPTGGQPREYAAGLNRNGVLYAIGGTPWQNGADQDGAVHRYQDGTWTAIAPVGGAGPILSGAAGVDSLGRIVVYGGFVMDGQDPGPERVYDEVEGLTDPVASRSAPESAIGYFAWASDAQHRLYGFGGGPGAGGPNSDYCDRYDAATDSWSELAALLTPAADACATYDGNGHMLVIGGINQAGSARLANVAQYDIAGNTWSDSAVPDFPVAISGARAVLGADGRVYVIGGETGPLGAGTTQAAVYKYEPASGAWLPVAALGTPRKWFAGVLGSDDYIYAIGGANDAGGTNTVERLFTPRCAEITGPEDEVAFAGSVAGFSVAVNGAAPFVYAWRKDGLALADGPTGTGSTISGASTSTLIIAQPGSADVGVYDVVVSNDCGAVQSGSANLTLLVPPSAPAAWVATNIHPGWADGGSHAYGIADGLIGGGAVMPTDLPDGRVLNLSHAFVWEPDTLTPIDVSPPGSVGGEILDAEGSLLVGWFWHIFSCPPWTCGWESAGYWDAGTLAFTETHMSGAEYDHAVATDGARLVTNAAFEYTEGIYTYMPFLWTPPQSVSYLDPGDVIDYVNVTAIDGVHQYGSMIPADTSLQWHAAMWSGSAGSLLDVHPAGYDESTISGAGDGQVVGQLELSGTQHAALWAGGTAAAIELHPAGATVSQAMAVHDGIQVGSVDGKAALWIGSAESHVNLHAFAPAEFASTFAEDVELAPDGSITAVGFGYNTTTGRYEAVVWRSAGFEPGDLNCDGALNVFDIDPFVLALTDPAGYATAYPACDSLLADMNGDGVVNAFDIDPFVEALAG